MTKRIKWFIWLGMTLPISIIVVCSLIYSQHEPILSWRSPRMIAIGNEWKHLYDSLMNTQDKSEYEDGIRKLRKALTKHFYMNDLQNLAHTSGSLPVRAMDRSQYENAVLEYMVDAFVQAGDRESLVDLLSTRMPDPLYYNNIEWYLVRMGKKLQDPIVVLGEAYAKSEEPYVRRLIADALRRGFTSLGVKGKSDDEFITNAMQWYEKEKSHLRLNIQYYSTGSPAPPYDVIEQNSGGRLPERHYEKHPPLFVEKTEQ
jgi:hypothetical protein